MKMKSNEKFFDNMKKIIKDGGVWQGDDAMMFKDKNLYYANPENYMYMKNIVTEEWLSKNVILIMNLSGSNISDREVFNSIRRAKTE